MRAGGRARAARGPAALSLALLGAGLAAAGAACDRPNESPPAPAPAPAAAAAPAPPASPRSRADRAAWRGALAWPDDCEPRAEIAPDDAGVALRPLGGTRVLAQVRCAPGAYQATYRFYVADTAARPVRAHALAFPDVTDAGDAAPAAERLRPGRTEEVIGLPTFDAARRELAVERKFRGPGDCGLRFRYAITDSGAVLRELRGKLDCDGKGPFDAARWPVLPHPPGGG